MYDAFRLTACGQYHRGDRYCKKYEGICPGAVLQTIGNFLKPPETEKFRRSTSVQSMQNKCHNSLPAMIFLYITPMGCLQRQVF